MKVIDRSSVSFDESSVLGKGASGTVYKGLFAGEDVAVKVFKQDSRGSDGKPEDEAVINSIIDHHFTVSSRGVFRKSDSEIIEGMVMELLENAVSTPCIYCLFCRFAQVLTTVTLRSRRR
jgi:predicted Ser/Thr protein kinase